jgi:mRNA interferase MazF
MVGQYIPAWGDIIKLNFNPTLGREQAGYRPALIVTPQEFNRATQLALVCPITSKIKGFNLEVILPEGLITSGAVLTFHVESLPTAIMEEVIAKLQAMIN